MDFMNSPYEDYTTEELDAKEKQLMIDVSEGANFALGISWTTSGLSRRMAFPS